MHKFMFYNKFIIKKEFVHEDVHLLRLLISVVSAELQNTQRNRTTAVHFLLI